MCRRRRCRCGNHSFTTPSPPFTIAPLPLRPSIRSFVRSSPHAQQATMKLSHSTQLTNKQQVLSLPSLLATRCHRRRRHRRYIVPYPPITAKAPQSIGDSARNCFFTSAALFFFALIHSLPCRRLRTNHRKSPLLLSQLLIRHVQSFSQRQSFFRHYLTVLPYRN